MASLLGDSVRVIFTAPLGAGTAAVAVTPQSGQRQSVRVTAAVPHLADRRTHRVDTTRDLSA